MEGFVKHKEGWYEAIRGHVLIVKGRSIDGLHRYINDHDIMPPYSFSDEDEHFQLSHPLTIEERVDYAWLYHRMKAFEKKVDNDPEPPHNPGPQAA